MTAWKEMVHKILNPSKDITVAIVGKYVALHDAYLSVAEALSHAGIETDTKVNIRWIDSEELDDISVDPKEVFEGIDGIVVPGGFGSRGVRSEKSVLSIMLVKTKFHSSVYALACNLL